uniref:Uncharacterized protein n=1 Tax=Anguilla anguilla TaxID=7936 RepID=A0A0E9TR01_ANGAN
MFILNVNHFKSSYFFCLPLVQTVSKCCPLVEYIQTTV